MLYICFFWCLHLALLHSQGRNVTSVEMQYIPVAIKIKNSIVYVDNHPFEKESRGIAKKHLIA